MYVPAHFKSNDIERMHALIHACPLGTLVTQGPGGLTANHVPFELDRAANLLRCHVARANPVWSDALAGADEALVIFRGADAYISPSWYASKAETHRVVPTWNYIAVHVHGTIAIRDDATWLRGLLARLTRRFEATQAQPWKMTDAPADYIDAMLDEIVGIEIPIGRLDGKWKMSQNRSEADRIGVSEGLKGIGADAVADEVLRSKPFLL
jgi:transcriptional regulator